MKYDANSLLLFGIVTLLASGGALGGSIQPSRVLVALSLIALLRLRTVEVGSELRLFIAMGSIWVLWGTLSLLWTPDFDAGWNQVVGIALGIVTAAVIPALVAKARSGWDAVRRGWVCAVLVTIPIAWWEIATNRHLAFSYGQIESGGLDSFSVQYASVTFGNRNLYAAFLCLAYPAILCSLALSRSLVWRVWYVALAVITAGLVIVDASRLGIATLIIEFVLYLLVYRKGRLAQKLLILAALVCLFGIGLYFQSSLTRFAMLRIGSALSGADESGRLRRNLVLNGVDLLERSYFLGIGAGGFGRGMITANARYGVGGLTDSHNMWIEIAADYGLLAILATVSWLSYRWFRMRASLALMRRAATDNLSGQSYAYGLILIPSLITIGAMNSHIITHTVLWIAIGSIISPASEKPQPVTQMILSAPDTGAF